MKHSKTPPGLSGRSLVLLAAAIAFAASATAYSVEGVQSAPMHIYVDAGQFFMWHTATGQTVHLEWDLPPSANMADLTIEGWGVNETRRGLTECGADVTLPPATDRRSENVYRITLAFDDGSSRTATLGAVCGFAANPDGAMVPVRCRLDSTGDGWSREHKRFVLPVPAGTETLTVAGQEVDAGLGGDAGWYGAGPFASGTWTRLEVAGETPGAAEIFAIPQGTILSLH